MELIYFGIFEFLIFLLISHHVFFVIVDHFHNDSTKEKHTHAEHAHDHSNMHNHDIDYVATNLDSRTHELYDNHSLEEHNHDINHETNHDDIHDSHVQFPNTEHDNQHQHTSAVESDHSEKVPHDSENVPSNLENVPQYSEDEDDDADIPVDDEAVSPAKPGSTHVNEGTQFQDTIDPTVNVHDTHTAVVEALPEGWTEYKTAEGISYYYNSATALTQVM